MCGIVAACRRSGQAVDPDVLIAMRDALRHRGPDDEGLLIADGVGLGHRRLSIVDLTAAGHQPLCNEDGTLWMVFNGEIYNFVELGRELRARGHRFRSQTDGEVILHLFEEKGAACVSELNGMFAFVIWDRRTGELFAARDRVGIKPFYYWDDPEWFLCASEIKALLVHPAVRPAVDRQGLADYLFAGHTLGEKTMFAGIRQLPPGHSLSLRDGRVTVREYWSPQYRYQWDRPFERVVDELAELLDDAVRIHCRSDAAVGCHLSGGLDSSLVTALAARHRGDLESFSIRFTGGRFYDESAHARAVARYVGTRHWEDIPGPEGLIASYAALMWHQDVPVHDAAGYSYFAASRLASEHVKVALTGHGGDEIFAGYPAQFTAAYGSTAGFDESARLSASGHGPSLGRFARVRRALRREGLPGFLARVGRQLAARTRSAALGDQWIALHCGLDPLANPGLEPRFRTSLAGYTPRTEYLAPLLDPPTDQRLDQLLHHDLRVYLPSLLHKEDRASMSVSLESRVPLLDHRVIEFLATVPPGLKTRDLVSKALLRAVARPLVPRTVVERRDKTPFPSPESQWVASGRLPIVDALLSEERSLDRGVFLADDLRRRALEPHARLTAFNVELWFRLFIDRDPVWLEAAAGGCARSAGVEYVA